MLLPGWLEYVAAVEREQRSCLEWLASDSAEWTPAPGLADKVAPDGTLRPYFGDTVVFPLDMPAIAALSAMQRALRAELPDLLAEPLAPSSFHVTLHDLAHGPEAQALRLHEDDCRRIFAASKTGPEPIRLRATAVYPSCRISLVLGLSPVTARDHELLDRLYTPFENLAPLSHWQRFHVTLDYFRPASFDRQQLSRLARALAALNPPDLQLRVGPRELAYQTFTNMNGYTTRLRLGDLP